MTTLSTGIEGIPLRGRLQASRIHETMPRQIGLSTLADIDDEVLRWLRRAYDENSWIPCARSPVSIVIPTQGFIAVVRMMVASVSQARRTHRVRASLALCASMVLAGCRGDDGDIRKRIAGDYVREIRGRPTNQSYTRQVLTLRANGTWVRTTQIETAGYPRESPPDSGTYRIEGNELALQSVVEPGAAPVHYTLAGDSLFITAAAQAQAPTGYDIEDEVLVRTR